VGARTASTVDLPAALFDAQMEALAATHRVVALDEALRVLRGEPGDPCVAVTFDDGTADLVDLALPILVRHEIPATWYVVTSFIDEQRSFGETGAPLTWDALREAQATGLVSIGSHTHRHQLMDRIADAAVADALDRSIDSIAENLGHAPMDFAYPKGLLGSTTAQAHIRQRFRSAALAGTRANVVGEADPYALARSPIQVGDGRMWFDRKVAGGMALEDMLRAALNRRRYAQATT